MDKHFLLPKLLVFFSLLCVVMTSQAESVPLQNLQKAYPDSIQKVTSNYIEWKDGTRMPIQGSFALFNYVASVFYHLDLSAPSLSKAAILHEQYEPLFRKMYGNSAAEVKRKLVTVYWMPNVFGYRYPLRVTTVNDVDKKIQRISAELEKLPPSYYRYLANPAGSFYWRSVAGEGYLSSHSFGIAMDINSSYSNYWLWDYLKLKLPISELKYHKLTYQNHVPMEIVRIFEKEGFLWGGRWYFYDTMHFEYRPELFI